MAIGSPIRRVCCYGHGGQQAANCAQDLHATSVVCELTARLQEFYSATKGVPGLEHGVAFDSPPDVLVTLTPVGVTRQPCDAAEADVALQQLASTLYQIHQVGWLHCDVRWPNVVLDVDGGRRWTLIDVEHARKIGERRGWLEHRQRLRALKDDQCPDVVDQATPLSDIFALGRMFLELTVLNDATRALAQRLVSTVATERDAAFRSLLC